MPNIALEEALALQKRIDKLDEQIVTNSRKSKEVIEIEQHLTKLHIQFDKLREQVSFQQSVHSSQLHNELSILVQARDGLLAQAQTKKESCIDYSGPYSSFTKT